MALLTKEQIFTVDDHRTEDVEVPEWGGEVRVRSISAAEKDRFEAGLTKIVNGKQKMTSDNYRARLVALCVIDENGNRLFTDKDIERLGSKSAAALDRVATAAQKLNGTSDEDIEELVTDFNKIPSGSSDSD